MVRKRRPTRAKPAAERSRAQHRKASGVVPHRAAERRYREACRLAEAGEYDAARRAYEHLAESVSDAKLRALIKNDLAALAAVGGDTDAARRGFAVVLAMDAECQPARLNLALLEADRVMGESAARTEAQAPQHDQTLRTQTVNHPAGPARIEASGSKVAILSFLFNWPSTGGGIVHTVELAKFLGKAGFEVRHVYARNLAWGVGKVEARLPFVSEALDFDDAEWTAAEIQRRFRAAVDRFAPDHVIVTDSWNSKPLLADAVREYPTILRFQAQECLCPLNNVRLLSDGNGRFRQCTLHQLANPDDCRRCVAERGHQSGSLHQAERRLCGVGSPEYDEILRRTLREAKAVLVVNPLQQAALAPYARDVRVVTAGMDPARFPWPPPDVSSLKRAGRLMLLFAGMVDEPMKGFAVLQAACERLWRRRQDFEVVVTDDLPGRLDAFTRLVGWQSQEDLPRWLQAADIVLVPTIAQEALGRTAVEGMAAGRPVVASRIGGLPFVVVDRVTGLLAEPGDPDDLARAIEQLLDDAELRRNLGLAGRRRFEERFAWPVIIERHYRPLLEPEIRGRESGVSGQPVRLAPSGSVIVPDPCPRTPGAFRLSLIVAVLESYEIVRRQLLHLGRILPPDCELILVDDGSEPSLEATCDGVPKSFPFRLIFTHDCRPWTQPKARNLGATLARSEKLLFFDIDQILTAELIAECLRYDGDMLHWRRRPAVLDEASQTEWCSASTAWRTIRPTCT